MHGVRYVSIARINQSIPYGRDASESALHIQSNRRIAQMTITELITELQAIRQKDGDIPVIVDAGNYEPVVVPHFSEARNTKIVMLTADIE